MRTFLLIAVCIGFLAFGSQVAAQVYVNFSVNQPALLQANAGPDIIICPGDTTVIGGSPVAVGGSPGYNFTWVPNTNLSSNNDPNPDAYPTVTTSYALQVVDARNCAAIDTMTVVVDTCVGIADPDLSIALAIYPNPTEGQFKVLIEGEFLAAPLELRVLDPAGRLVESRALGLLSGKLESGFSLDALSRGVYLVELKAGEEKFVRRLILR